MSVKEFRHARPRTYTLLHSCCLQSCHPSVYGSNQENDKYLLLVFEGKMLDNNRLTVDGCGIKAGDTLEMREDGGITFKLLSREHTRREKLKKALLAQEGDGSPRLQQPRQPPPNANDIDSGSTATLEEPLMPAALSTTRPASPDVHAS